MLKVFIIVSIVGMLCCFDTVCWVTVRASGLKKLSVVL